MATEKQTVHDWSSGELVEYEIEVEAQPKADPADDANEPA